MNFWENDASSCCSTGKWSIERLVFAIAGALVLFSTVFGFLVHSNLFFLTGFIGFMQLFFAFTGICPMAMILKKMGFGKK